MAVKRRKKSISARPAVSHRFSAQRPRTATEKIADFLTGFFGTVGFLVANLAFFVVWIIWNTGLVPGLEPFDTFPFGLLTLIVSLEAIALAIIVLMSQNREAKTTAAREEIDVAIDVHSERQIAVLMRRVDAIAHHLKVAHDEEEDGVDGEPVDMNKLKKNVYYDLDH